MGKAYKAIARTAREEDTFLIESIVPTQKSLILGKFTPKSSDFRTEPGDQSK